MSKTHHTLKRHSNWKIIGIAVLLVGLVSSVSLVQQQYYKNAKAVADTASLLLTPSTVIVNPDETFVVNLSLDSGGQDIQGADIMIGFNKSKVALQTLSIPSHPILKAFGPVQSDGVFDTAGIISKANRSGIIDFSLLTYDKTVGGSTGVFNGIISPVVSLTFKALPGTMGQTDSIYIVYNDSTATTDTNIVLAASPNSTTAEDILAAPTSAVTVTIGNFPTPTPSVLPSSSPVPSVSPIPSVSPTPVPSLPPGNMVVSSADTYVMAGGRGDTNYGAANKMEIVALGQEAIGYVTFDLTAYSGMNVAQATFRLNATAKNSAGGEKVYLANSTTWEEMTLTYNNQPGYQGSVINTFSAVPIGMWAETDITDFVNTHMGQKVSVALVSGGGSSTFYTKEAGRFAPHLSLIFN